MIARFAPLLLLVCAAPPPASTAGPFPISYRIGSVQRMGEGRLFVNVKLWSVDQTPVLMAIPTGHAGWAFASQNGVRGKASQFRTPGYQPGGDRPFAPFSFIRGNERTVLHYAEPVNVPVTIDARAPLHGRVVMRLVFVTVQAGQPVWTPQEIVAPVSLD